MDIKHSKCYTLGIVTVIIVLDSAYYGYYHNLVYRKENAWYTHGLWMSRLFRMT